MAHVNAYLKRKKLKLKTNNELIWIKKMGNGIADAASDINHSDFDSTTRRWE